MKPELDYCYKCGGFIEWDLSVALLTYPMKAKGKCKDCGEIHYSNYDEVRANATRTN